jgi:hypothetical protein
MILAHTHYREVRARLRNPPNAVPDRGIDLRRKPEPVVEVLPEVTRAFWWPPQVTEIAIDRTPPSVVDIQIAVSIHFQISVLDIRSSRRTKDVVLPRHVAMYLARKLTLSSMPRIGFHFNKRDHTTVLHAWHKIGRMIAEGHPVADDVAQLMEQLG